MVITKMNNVLVKHSRILFGLFTGIIIISFVWFFTPGASGNILFGPLIGIRLWNFHAVNCFDRIHKNLLYSNRDHGPAIPCIFSLQGADDGF